jgi:uncharacterized protein
MSYGQINVDFPSNLTEHGNFASCELGGASVLLEFGFKNFICFKESVSISFRLDSNCPPSISHGRNFTTVLGVKGANGSGKTNILKGIAFLADFCANSFYKKPEEAIFVNSYFNNDQPIEFYAEFSLNGVGYRYELSITDSEIKRECIYKRKNKKIKILERVNNELVFRIKEFASLDAIKFRRNASIISTAHQYEFGELNEIYNFFKNFYCNVNYGGLKEIPHDIQEVSKFLRGRKETFKFVNDFIAKCDAGISKIDIVEIKDKEKEQEIKFVPVFYHKVDGKQHPILSHTESTGTKALFRILPAYQLTLDEGGVLVIDEFDNHLHPHILPKLLQLFLDPKINKKSAQLLFTTHDSEILNLLGRYRTYLANKVDNESFTYRLDEIPGDILRNDRPILPAYNEGRIGGIPKI